MSNFYEAGRAAMTSNKDDWETPQDLFESLDATYHFGLDAASTHENAKCKDHYTAEDDGLAQSWQGHGTVWCNPPYGRTSPKWIEKMAKEARGGMHRRTTPSAYGYSGVPRIHLQQAKRAHRVHKGPSQVRGERHRGPERTVSIDARLLQLLGRRSGV